MDKPSKDLSRPSFRRRLRFTLLSGLALGAMLGCGAGTNATAPTVTGFTPGSGNYLSSPNTVLVTGTGFSAGVTGASLGGVPVAPGTVNGDTQLIFSLPVTAMTGVITVVTAGGSASTINEFIVTPAVTGISTVPVSSPAAGPVATPVTITGYGLAGITGITLNGTAGLLTVAVPYTTQTAEQITFSIPAGAATGSNTITLLNNYGSAVAPILIPFDVTP